MATTQANNRIKAAFSRFGIAAVMIETIVTSGSAIRLR